MEKIKMNLCDKCKKGMETIALTKKWSEISYPLILCEPCKLIYAAATEKPLKSEAPPNKRCFICRRIKSAYDYWGTDEGEKPICRRCHDLYYKIKNE